MIARGDTKPASSPPVVSYDDGRLARAGRSARGISHITSEQLTHKWVVSAVYDTGSRTGLTSPQHVVGSNNDPAAMFRLLIHTQPTSALQGTQIDGSCNREDQVRGACGFKRLVDAKPAASEAQVQPGTAAERRSEET